MKVTRYFLSILLICSGSSANTAFPALALVQAPDPSQASTPGELAGGNRGLKSIKVAVAVRQGADNIEAIPICDFVDLIIPISIGGDIC